MNEFDTYPDCTMEMWVQFVGFQRRADREIDLRLQRERANGRHHCLRPSDQRGDLGHIGPYVAAELARIDKAIEEATTT